MNEIKKNILHVDDDLDFHAYVEAMLGDVAHVTSVSTAKEFRELLAGCVFDLFLLDLVLKDGSGSSLIRELKPAFPDTPIIILSAHDLSDVIEGADALFIKGRLEAKDFIHTVNKLLN